MDIIHLFFNVILHLDDHLVTIISQYGVWTYLILFLIIFLETGVILTPYLPGDSLIFAIGALTAIGAFNLPLIFIVLAGAAILGDSLNYSIGGYFGPKVFKKNYKWLNKRALEKTEGFFNKHGKKTIILARFVPIVRTFAPFLAGVSKMKYKEFLKYNIVGGVLWVGAFLFAGYFFGNIPVVKEHFGAVIIIIILLSVIPVAIEVFKYYREMKIQEKSKAKIKNFLNKKIFRKK